MFVSAILVQIARSVKKQIEEKSFNVYERLKTGAYWSLSTNSNLVLIKILLPPFAYIRTCLLVMC